MSKADWADARYTSRKKILSKGSNLWSTNCTKHGTSETTDGHCVECKNEALSLFENDLSEAIGDDNGNNVA